MAAPTSNPQSRGILIASAVLAATLLPIVLGERWLDWVVILQSSPLQPLPSPDIRTDYLTGVFWAGLIGLLVLLWGSLARFRAPLMIAWVAKALIALGPMLFFDYTYGVDPDGYFMNASTPGFEWLGLHLGQGTQNTQMLAWLHFRWLSSSYHASRLSFSLIGLVAAFLVYRSAVVLTGRQDRWQFYVFALTPSVLFWSSTLGKDVVTLLGISAYAFGVVSWHRLARNRYLLWMAAGLLLAAYTRVWLGPILLIPLIALGSLRTESVPRKAAFIALGIAGLIASPYAVELALGVNILQSAEFLGTTSMLSQSFAAGGSTQVAPELTSTGELVRFAPLGIFTVLFRPMPGEVPNLFGTLAGLENIAILFLAARAAWRTKTRDLRDPLVAWAVGVVLLWAAVYSVHSFQNLGTATRQRLEIMPVFMGLLLYLGRQRARLPNQEVRIANRGHHVVAMRPGI